MRTCGFRERLRKLKARRDVDESRSEVFGPYSSRSLRECAHPPNGILTDYSQCKTRHREPNDDSVKILGVVEIRRRP